MKKSTSGFTLIELLTVIAIIAILASVMIVLYNGTQARARDAARRVDISNITKALEQYYSDNGAYPIPSGTSSVINSTWYTSGDSSWSTLAAALNGDIDTLPVDPLKKANANPLNVGNYGYAYYSGAFCGHVAGQWYLLVYRFENSPQTKFSDGTCTTNPLGDNYYANGASYYRSTK